MRQYPHGFFVIHTLHIHLSDFSSDELTGFFSRHLLQIFGGYRDFFVLSDPSVQNTPEESLATHRNRV